MLSQEWFAAQEIADLELPEMPGTKRGVQEWADRHDWQREKWLGKRWRNRQARGGGVEYHYSVLPVPAQASLLHRFAEVVRDEVTEQREENARNAQWAWFDKQKDTKKKVAEERLKMVKAVQALISPRFGKSAAIELISAQNDVSRNTLRNWLDMVEGRDICDWMAYLLPRHAGRTERSEVPPEAMALLAADYLRNSKPTKQDCIRRLRDVAEDRGWELPSDATLSRRLDEISTLTRVYKREGEKALKHLAPPQQRDRSGLHAMEAVNADGHKVDVFVKWESGVIGRPMIVAFQDLYSGKIVSWKVGDSENFDVVRMAFAEMVRTYGIPGHCTLDNTRTFAGKRLTGGTANRFRFKVKDDEPMGIITGLGTQIHWALPYSGQSKPIERGFRDFAQSIAKRPEFEGAYTGNNPMAKPENYGTKAVPIDQFVAVFTRGVIEHNARLGRRGGVCDGRSFDQAFDESYARSRITKATEEQYRMLLLTSETVLTNKKDGSIKFAGNRYWSQGLIEHRGIKVQLRFDPDNLHQPVHVSRLDGTYLCEADCIEAVGFYDTAGSRVQARLRGNIKKLAKEQAVLESQMSVEELIAAQPVREAPPVPESKIVRIFHGNTVRAAVAEEDADDWAPEEMQFVANMQRAGLRLVETPDADE